MYKIKGLKGRDIYYYDEENLFIEDKEGNRTKLYEPINLDKLDLIDIFLDGMFKKLYMEQNEFKKLCQDMNMRV